MNLVVITSCLNPIKKNLSYTNIRSVYTVEERYIQTINTINTIKKYIPQPYIVLLECSKDIESYEVKIKHYVNEYHNYCNNKQVLEAVNSIYKNYGEVMTLMEFFNNFKDIDKINDLYKITGRYWLNENFNLNTYINDKNNFFSVSESQVVSTRFFKVTNSQINTFIEKLNNDIKNDVIAGVSIEASIYKNIDFKHIDVLGLSGNISVNGDLVVE
jgi:hypothetical protein